MRGIIFDIKHYAIHDGPGIRTTVFLKGCPLGCWWCHNPESRSKEIVSYNKPEMIGGKCLTEVAEVGKYYTTNQVMKEVEKDIVLFEESGGGVTFSGGEPFFQPDFLVSLLKASKLKDLHTCVDTTGYTSLENLRKAAPFTDLFLFDLKHFNPDAHIRYTDVSNKTILANLKWLDSTDIDIHIRYPLIPGMNDDESDLLRMMSFLSKMKRKHPVDILPYHKIGSHKYKRFGLEYKMDGIEEPTKEHIENIKKTIEATGFETKIGG